MSLLGRIVRGHLKSYLKCEAFSVQSRSITYDELKTPRPKPGPGFRRKVPLPEEYTVKPVMPINLGGRDPVSGRIVVGTVGGGIKHKYHWIVHKREGPTDDSPPIEERVIQILTCGCRSAKVALVGRGNEMKYYLATVNMKPGDIIRSSSYLPPMTIEPNEGDAHPLGALPVGTLVHNIEREPGKGGVYLHAAGCFGTILKHSDKRVIVKMPTKNEFAFDARCIAVVGQLSNPEHGSIPIGSGSALRLLGFRPRSGLWQRKDSRFGRRIRPPKKIDIDPKAPEPLFIKLDG